MLPNVALKPMLIAGLARQVAPVRRVVNAVTGLGSTLIESGERTRPRLSGRLVAFALRRVLSIKDGATIVLNEAHADALAGLGAERNRMLLIRGSGVDLAQHLVLPEPDGPVTVGVAARMIEAVRRGRSGGVDLRLTLAGDTDTENPTSIPVPSWRRWYTNPASPGSGTLAISERCGRAAISRREGLPKALLEAAAAGRPLVATNVAGCREVAVDGINSRLVPVDDAAALAKALGELALDAGLRASLSAASRKMVESDLSADAVAAATVALYRRLLQE